MFAISSNVQLAIVSSATTLLVAFGVWYLTSRTNRSGETDRRRGEAYIEALVVVQDVMAKSEPRGPWMGDYGGPWFDDPNLTPHERAITRAKVQVWGSKTVREQFDDLLESEKLVERWALHGETVAAEARSRGESAEGLMDEPIGGELEKMRALVESLEQDIRKEMNR